MEVSVIARFMLFCFCMLFWNCLLALINKPKKKKNCHFCQELVFAYLDFRFRFIYLTKINGSNTKYMFCLYWPIYFLWQKTECQQMIVFSVIPFLRTRRVQIIAPRCSGAKVTLMVFLNLARKKQHNVVYVAASQHRDRKSSSWPSLGECQAEIRHNPILMHLSQCD